MLEISVGSIYIFSISKAHHLCQVVVWNGQEARVYEWSDEMGDSKPQQTAKFPTKARAIALRDETIFRASNNLVELCNLQGIVRQKITFSEGEGSPTHLDVNGDYLAVATDTGLIKIFQVTRREPKQLGSPGHFHLWAQAQNLLPSNKTPGGLVKTRHLPDGASSGHAIRSIRCNADGTRVSILADHVRQRDLQTQKRLIILPS